MRKLLERIFFGFLIPLRGIRLIFGHRDLFFLSLIPAGILGVILSIGLWTGWGWVATLVSGFAAAASGFLGGLLYGVLFALGYLVFTGMLLVGLILAGNIVTGPVNAILAERALRKLGVIQDKPFLLTAFIKSSLRMLVAGLLRALIFLGVGAFALILSFIPVLHILAWFLGGLMVFYDCLDYSLETMEFNLSRRFKVYREYLPESCGAALAVGLTMAIPGLNLFLLPALVIGASTLAAKIPQGKYL